MGKQKGYNWKARQQGGTLETDVVARWVVLISLIILKKIIWELCSRAVSIGGIICGDNLSNGQVKREGGCGWS